MLLVCLMLWLPLAWHVLLPLLLPVCPVGFSTSAFISVTASLPRATMSQLLLLLLFRWSLQLMHPD